MDDAFSSECNILIEFLAMIYDNDRLGVRALNGIEKLMQVCSHARGKQNDRMRKRRDSLFQAWEIGALYDDFKVEFTREHTRRAGAKNRLIIRQYYTLPRCLFPRPQI